MLSGEFWGSSPYYGRVKSGLVKEAMMNYLSWKSCVKIATAHTMLGSVRRVQGLFNEEEPRTSGLAGRLLKRSTRICFSPHSVDNFFDWAGRSRDLCWAEST